MSTIQNERTLIKDLIKDLDKQINILKSEKAMLKAKIAEAVKLEKNLYLPSTLKAKVDELGQLNESIHEIIDRHKALKIDCSGAINFTTIGKKEEDYYGKHK